MTASAELALWVSVVRRVALATVCAARGCSPIRQDVELGV